MGSRLTIDILSYRAHGPTPLSRINQFVTSLQHCINAAILSRFEFFQGATIIFNLKLDQSYNLIKIPILALLL